VSKHWHPDEELLLARNAPAQPRPRLPAASLVGLAVVAAACVGAAILLYRLAGPRDIFGS